MKEKEVSVIGASGFIGLNLLRSLSKEKPDYKITIITRNENNPILKNFLETGADINIVQCDHLDFQGLKKAVSSAEIIFDTAGLAWQKDSLVEQIRQNAVSAYFVGALLREDQRLVWTSTNAIDALLLHIPKTGRNIFEKQTDKLADLIISGVKIDLLIDKYIDYYHNFIFDLSYAFSKYLGQTILEKLSSGNIRVLKISDVYGPGQDVSKGILDPKKTARRIQRFVAAYSSISNGFTDWIPKKGSNLHGFFRDGDKIIHQVRDDDIFPIFIDDTVSMMIRAVELKNINKTVLEVSGRKVSNLQLAETLRDFFNVKVEVKTQNNREIEIKERSKDLHLLGFGRDQLVSLREGLRRWL